MQIHEITLKEARPMAPAVAQNVTKLKQQRQARTMVPPAPQATVAPTASPYSASLGETDYAQNFTDYLLHKNPAFNSVPRYKNRNYFVPGATNQPATKSAAPTPPSGTTAASTHSTTNIGPVVATTPQGQSPSAPVTPAQYPPITLGSGPKAQVYVNKGRGYVDSKTGNPIPPSIVKAMGI